MTNINYLKYFFDAARLGSITSSSKVNYVSSSAISQGIKWLENHYQLKLIEHGKNKFNLTTHGLELSRQAEKLLLEVSNFEENVQLISKPNYEIFNFSIQQSIANTVVSKVIEAYSNKYPYVELKIRIGTSHRCMEMMNQSIVNYSISMDNVSFEANAIPLYNGKFVFISARNDNRIPEEAGFLTTEDTKEVIELKSQYYKKFKQEIPISSTVSSWGVIATMALAGVGIAYVPDYILKGIDKTKYKVRKIDVPVSRYIINFYYKKFIKLSSEQMSFVKQVKLAFKL